MTRNILNHFQSKQRSVEERLEAGKALRKKISRTRLGDYQPAKKRIDPVSILEDQA